jgi:hypothetical protein
VAITLLESDVDQWLREEMTVASPVSAAFCRHVKIDPPVGWLGTKVKRFSRRVDGRETDLRIEEDVSITHYVDDPLAGGGTRRISTGTRRFRRLILIETKIRDPYRIGQAESYAAEAGDWKKRGSLLLPTADGDDRVEWRHEAHAVTVAPMAWYLAGNFRKDCFDTFVPLEFLAHLFHVASVRQLENESECDSMMHRYAWRRSAIEGGLGYKPGMLMFGATVQAVMRGERPTTY